MTSGREQRDYPLRTRLERRVSKGEGRLEVGSFCDDRVQVGIGSLSPPHTTWSGFVGNLCGDGVWVAAPL